MNAVMWQADVERVVAGNLAGFQKYIERTHGHGIASYQALHDFSLSNSEAFWSGIWDYCGVRSSTSATRVISNPDDMMQARFFADARLNFAENLMARPGPGPALIFRAEDGQQSQWSWERLRATVSRLAQAMRAGGVVPGDRVAAMLPNLPETIASMLAAAAVGATWSSCSPDFGTGGVVDRFGQIAPKLLIAVDGYLYNGKIIDIAAKVNAVAAAIPSLEKVIIVPFRGGGARLSGKLIDLDGFISPFQAGEIDFAQLAFDHPLYILFSSGTTGAPKCIVHRAGGILLQHLKEHQLHCDIRPGDRLFYFTTCGWMMWNWLASGLASGATLVLFDGSPFYPGPEALFGYADEVGVTHFGTSAKFIDAVKKSGLKPGQRCGLKNLRTILSTGSPLAAESFDFVYQHIKPNVHLASISGGTDLCACFVGGNPAGPVRRGEIQAPMLGMAVQIYDAAGQPLGPGAGKGELVCTAPFPSQPIGFWNDPDGTRYTSAYYSRFPGVWCQGDFAEWTKAGGIIIHGRSDATLNPGGVRIGTAEIYAQVEPMEEMIEAIAIGQEWQGDTRIVLFVVLAPGRTLDEALIKAIKQRIRRGASPRHVPAIVLQVDDIP
ncbi:MAG: acetoacetate--CoA ligase, partial [Hyphomicrobiales bacterium]